MIPITDPADVRLDVVRDLKKADNSRAYVCGEGPLVAGRVVDSRYPLRCIIGFEKKIETFRAQRTEEGLSLIHISEPTRPRFGSRMPSSA